MALNESGLGSEIAGQISNIMKDELGYKDVSLPTSQISKISNAIANAVVSHIKTNAAVDISGVQMMVTGQGATGPIAGTVSSIIGTGIVE